MSARRWIAVSLALALVVVIVNRRVLGNPASERTIATDVWQGVVAGGVLGLITAQLLARVWSVHVNGWTTMLGAGEPGKGMLFRAASAQIFLGPVNVPQEAMYWTTSKDGAGHRLDGRREYVMRFPPGGLPPNDAFWSLTMGDAKNHFVPNPIRRYSVSDRTGLEPNPDGSVDIYVQNTAPAGHGSNWLPAPAGPFKLWLRVYVPGAAILDGTYSPPPMVGVKR